MDQIMRIEDLSAAYGGKEVLSHLSTGIPRRGITAIIGPSGCGKTTFLQCLNGMLRTNKEVRISGNIFLGDANTADLPREELCRRVGLVFQTPAPFPFSIYKNMTYGLTYYGMKDKKELEKTVREKLIEVGLYYEVKDELHKSALKLSGGQQQRLCIARALTVRPEVLLLDEPCSALDVKATALIEKLLMDLKKNYSLVIVTHNIAQARRIADRLLVMVEGRLVEEGNAEQVFTSPQESITAEFLAGAF